MIALQEYLSFIKHERQFGLRVVAHDMVVLAKLLDQDRVMGRILDVCAKKRWKCTFFMTARNLEKNQKWLDRFLDEGHEVGSHSYTHRLLTNLHSNDLKEEFRLSEKAFEEYGVKPKGFRPPFLVADLRVRFLAKEYGFAYLSSEHGGKSYQDELGVWEYPVTKPYDWFGTVVERKGAAQIISEWEAEDGTVRLIHPRYFDKFEQHLDFEEGQDLRVASRPDQALSFDVY